MNALRTRITELRTAGVIGDVSLTSPGFWEGLGNVTYAETECGVCVIPGDPPLEVPYLGESAIHHAVNSDTFSLAGIVVYEGRGFTPEDGPGTEPVAVVSRGFASRNFQDGQALGRRVRIGWARTNWHTVVGVIEPLPRATLPARQLPLEDVLVPVAQVPPPDIELVGIGLSSLSAEGSDIGFTLRKFSPFGDRGEALDGWIEWHADLWRWSGLVGLLLAIAGVVLTVTRRVKEEASELALRRALGARRADLVRRHLGFGIKVGAGESALGCWIAFFSVALITPEGFGLPATVGPVFVAPALLLTACTGTAAAASAYIVMRGTPY